MSESPSLNDFLFRTEAMRDIFSDRAYVQRLLDVESALARALADIRVIPSGAAATIQAQCRADLYDVKELARAASVAGNPVIPLVKALTAAVGRRDAAAAGFVHWGATSQDVMDTALVLQLRAALDLIDADLAALADAAAHLADKHRRTVLAGRTWLQQASPVTLGLKAAAWLSGIERHRARLAQLRERVLVVEFGGAAGTLAALGEQGLEIAGAFAHMLDLALPDLPWHAMRDRVAETATMLGLIVGTLGKIARDVSLMSQNEVAEAFEPHVPGRGTSSAMPHKRNPIGASVVLAAAVRVPALVSTMLSAMVQEHERGLGGWHAEWETLPEICELTAGALAHAREMIARLEVDVPQMRANLDVTHGLIFAEAVAVALGKYVGRHTAHERIEKACQRAIEEKRHLRDVLAEEKDITTQLAPGELEKLFAPENYLGVAEKFIDRVLASRRKKK